MFTTLDRPVFRLGNYLFGANAPPVPNFAPSAAFVPTLVPPPTRTVAVATAAELGLISDKEE